MNKGKKFLSDLKLHSDYYKWNKDEDRYETWEEACEDIINGHRQKYAGIDIEKYLEKAKKSMVAQDILASQRNLQYRYKQIMQHNMRMFNCTVGHIMRNRIFQEVFYISLCGSGFGGSLLLPFVANISKIHARSETTKVHVIEDSIEGWSDALGVLMSSYLVDNQPFPQFAGYHVRFDYSLIREKGSYISGGFKAPGHEGLKQSLERIELLVDNWIKNEGETMRPILVYDILCHAADAVLSGGVRRSALSFIVDPNDSEMIMAKTGNWRTENPQRARSNNSVLLLRSEVKKEEFEFIVKLNEGTSDIGFVFANTWFDLFNPCFEISFTPVLTDVDLTTVRYDFISDFIELNEDKFGIQGCNLDEINGEHSLTEELFLEQAEAGAILGTLQAGYTDFPYLGKVTEELFKREALLGVSITGWMNNPKLFNPEMLRKGAAKVIEVNKELAEIIGINQAARNTCTKPSGNAAVVLGTSSGLSTDEAEWMFRVMVMNKGLDASKWLEENMPFMLEESVNSPNGTDWVVYVPIMNPKNGLYKKDMLGVKHLEFIKLVQENWVMPGTVKELGISPNINHNVSCTVTIDNKQEVVDYIWQNKDIFTAVSFMSNYAAKEYNQAPWTEVKDLEEIIAEYGNGALLASGLIVDGLYAFGDNLWEATDCVKDVNKGIDGTRIQVFIKKDWIKRAKKFAKNYFKGDVQKMIYCLKDVYLFHKWNTINRQFKSVDFGKILTKPTFKDVNEYGAMACSGGSCEITRI